VQFSFLGSVATFQLSLSCYIQTAYQMDQNGRQSAYPFSTPRAEAARAAAASRRRQPAPPASHRRQCTATTRSSRRVAAISGPRHVQPSVAPSCASQDANALAGGALWKRLQPPPDLDGVKPGSVQSRYALPTPAHDWLTHCKQMLRKSCIQAYNICASPAAASSWP
jgi:hypothetical protein